MTYPPNEIDWNVGSIVIHSAYAKEPRMLMRVIQKRNCEVCGEMEYITEYIFPERWEKIDKKYVKRKAFVNDRKYLLNPKDFDIDVLSILANIHFCLDSYLVKDQYKPSLSRGDDV